MPDPAAPAAPAVPAPAAPAPAAPAPPAKRTVDPWNARLLADMGRVVGDDGVLKEALPEAPEKINSSPTMGVTLGEHNRMKAEREAEAAAAAKPPGDAPLDPPADPPPAADPNAKPDEKAADKPADPPADRPGDKPADPPPPPKKKKVEVGVEPPIEDIIEGVVRRVQAENQPPPKPDIQQPATDPDAAFIATLSDIEREEYELARFAAKSMPEKYGDQPKATVNYLKKVNEYIDSKKKEDPRWDPADDDDYATFIEENRPDYSGADRRRLERAQIVEQAKAELEAQNRPVREEQEMRSRATEMKPQIDQDVQAYQNALLKRMADGADNPIAPALANPEADPLAANIAKHYAANAASLAREYIELATGIKRQTPIDPAAPLDSPKNQAAVRQGRLFAFIDQQESTFLRDGGAELKRDGKQFVTRSQYARMPDEMKARHWTIGHEDVLDSLQIAAVEHAKNAVKAEHEKLKAAGYTRTPKPEPPKKEEPKPAAAAAPASSPKSTVSSSPGAATGAAVPSGRALLSKEELESMHKGGVKRWD